MNSKRPQDNGMRSFRRTGQYLDTRGQSVLSVAICDRCRFKVFYTDLQQDHNFPGLRVCPACRDALDPYRLPARQTEKITLRFPRPDDSISVPDNALTNTPNWTVPLADEIMGTAQQQAEGFDLATEQTIKRTGFESLTEDLPYGPSSN